MGMTVAKGETRSKIPLRVRRIATCIPVEPTMAERIIDHSISKWLNAQEVVLGLVSQCGPYDTKRDGGKAAL